MTLGSSRILSASLLLFATATADAFQLNQRWTDTALNPPNTQQGSPMSLTWSFIPDGTTTTGPGAASNLIAFLDSILGSGPGGSDLTMRPWFQYFDSSFERWGQLSGLSYQYEPMDDGVAQSAGNLGIVNTRGDLRIGGRLIDGPSNVLAFNSFPNNGDMVLDTGDSTFYGNSSSNYIRLRNVIAHEHGHGLGLSHVESSDRGFLMEPFIQTSFDGPQLDDLLGAQRHYGDVYEKSNGGLGNDVAANATSLGSIASGGSAAIGTPVAGVFPRILLSNTDFISIDDNSDMDFLSFSVAGPSQVDLNLAPVGLTYQQGPQGGSQSAFNVASLSDLTLALMDIDGATVLDLKNATGAGGSEAIADFLLPSAGTYYARITGSANNIQLYQLSVAVSAVAAPGDFDNNGLFNCDDVNGLVAVIAAGTNDIQFDLTSDALVNTVDLSAWLSLAGAENLSSGNAYLPGDANLDGSVDGSDFGEWNADKFTALAEWCSGDFNADGQIDGSDFNIWNANKFTSSGLRTAAVPEPAVPLLLLATGVLLGTRRRE